MQSRATTLTLAALASVAPTLKAQTPQPIGRPAAEFAEPFTRISGIRELADGKVIVADQREKLVQLLDLRTGAAQPIGREGQGPGEYALPTGLLAQPNNQTLLVDLLNSRYLKIGPDGKPGETVSPPDLSATSPGGGAMRIGGLVNPRGVDNQGRLYFQDLGIRQGGESADSVAVLRWTVGSARVDTVGWVQGPRTTVTSTGGGGGSQGMRMTVGMAMVWGPAEQWAVAGNGRVARVTPEPYRVIWYDANRRATAGPVVPYTPRRVTEADKAEYREAQRANPPTMIMRTVGGSGGGVTTSTPPASAMPEPTFAETMPAFTGGNSVLATPDGEVWVLRTRAAGDKIPVYDVFNSAGRLVRKVSLAARSRVVGFGATSVYVARMDEDDLEYLQRYSRPAVGAP